MNLTQKMYEIIETIPDGYNKADSYGLALKYAHDTKKFNENEFASWYNDIVVMDEISAIEATIATLYMLMAFPESNNILDISGYITRYWVPSKWSLHEYFERPIKELNRDEIKHMGLILYNNILFEIQNYPLGEGRLSNQSIMNIRVDTMYLDV